MSLKARLEAQGVDFDTLIDENPEAILRALAGDMQSLVGDFDDVEITQEDIDEVEAATPSSDFVIPFGGQFLADRNRFYGWGLIGPHDNVNSQYLGSLGVSNPSYVSGGLHFPFDVRVKRMGAWHRNNSSKLGDWGWRIGCQKKNANSTSVSWTDILSEVADNGGKGPRDYKNTRVHQTDIDLDAVIPAGEVMVLGVECKDSRQSRRYVQVMSGYFQFERA